MRLVGEADLPALLALNNRHASALSPLDAAALARLVAMAFRARVAGEAEAMLLALDQSADYASPNFAWVRARRDRFAYVDRVVVDERARGRGLARALYADLFAAAREAGHDRVLCEVNLRPPNPASDALHARLGFAEVGRAEVGAREIGARVVRYLERRL